MEISGSTDATVADLRRQVAEITDRNEIIDLIGRFGVLLDEKRFDDARSIYTEDAVGPFGTRGVDALAERSRKNHEPFEGIWHITGNFLIELDGDRASVRANYIGTHVKYADRPDAHFDAGGFYDFEVVRAPVGWRISRVGINEVWRSGSVDPQWLTQVTPADTN